MCLSVIIRLIIIKADRITFSFIIIQNDSVRIICPVVLQLFFADTVPSMISLLLSTESDKLDRCALTEVTALHEI